MKLRKKDFEVPMNFSFSRWIIQKSTEELSDFLDSVGFAVTQHRPSAPVVINRCEVRLSLFCTFGTAN